MLFYLTEYCFRCRKLSFMLLLVICVLLYILIVMKEEPQIKSVHVRWLKIPPDKVLHINLDTETIINEIDAKFLSFSIDTSQIYKGLRNPTLKNKGLRKRVAHLGGGYLRVGGNAADMLVFSPSIRGWPENEMPTDTGLCYFERIGCFPRSYIQKPIIQKFSMSAEDWVDINEFSIYVGLKLLFDLNVLLRNGSTWNFSNAEYLIDYSNAYQYNIDWQLGNEPNSFPFEFGIELPPEDLARDFNTLRRILNRYKLYNSSKLVGPDVTNPSKTRRDPIDYMVDFLDNSPDVGAVTWHHYYTGPNTTIEKLLEPTMYEEFRNVCKLFINITKEKASSKPNWITETGSAYGGGIPDISDRFVGSFLWIDKLGVSAREGISLVVRQSLYRNYYGLLDSDDLLPNPDYWISVLFKKLVGRKVLNVGCNICSSIGFRIYGHCSTTFPRLVLYGVNLSSTSIGVSLPLSTNTTALLYSLTSPSLKSRIVELNGEQLYLTFTDALPAFRPIALVLDVPIIILPHSIFFLEIDTIVTACL